MINSGPLLDDTFPLPLDRPFTTAHSLRAGLSRHDLRRLLAEGYVRRLLPGVHVVAQLEDSQLLRARAIRLVIPDRAVVTDETAGWLAGARMILPPGSDRATPPVTVFSTVRGARLRNDLCASGTRDLEPTDVIETHGVLATTPLRTALDLGRLRYRDRALACMDSLLALNRFDREDLLAQIERFRGFRGVRQLRFLAPLTDPRSESPGESALRLRFHDACVPAPVPQFAVLDHGDFLGRADLAIPELRLIAEYDGEKWHGPDARAHDERRRARFEDAGWVVRVFRRADVFGRDQRAVAVLQAAVREARANLGLGRAEQRLA